MSKPFFVISLTWSVIIGFFLSGNNYASLSYFPPKEKIQFENKKASPAFATTYYISTTGNDATGDGSIGNPWRNLEKINTLSLVAGDIVYIRAGTYNSTSAANATRGIVISGKNGTAGAHITISAYPPDFPSGGRVVYNMNNIARTNSNYALYVLGCSYIDFIGINVVGAAQTNTVVTTGTITIAWLFDGGNHITAINCESSISMTGFRCDNSNDATYTNCDAHNHSDPLTGPPTGAYSNSDGFSRTGTGNNAQRTVYNYCRSWCNSDDGWDCFNTPGAITYNGCWAFKTTYSSLTGVQYPTGDGNGFKMGPCGGATGLLRTVRNCLSAGNKLHGFDQNAGTCNIQMWNNSSLQNLGNDFKFGYNPSTTVHDFRNNVSFGNGAIDGLTTDNSNWNPNDHNTWNGGVVCNAADFQSLDVTTLAAPRQADGSLPIVTYGHLVPGSDLIDAGTNATGLTYNGTADMGAFETTTTTPPTGGNWFVATTGSDANNGTTIGTPFLTLSKAESVVTPGDVVSVAAGTYNMGSLTMSHSGTSGNPITFQTSGAVTINLSSDGPLVTGSWRVFNGFSFTGTFTRAIWIKSSANNIIKNVTVTQGNAGIAYGLQVGEDAVTGGEAADNNTLDNVRIIGTAGAGQHIHGVLLGGGGSGNILKNSYFANTYYGLVNKGDISTLCFNNVFNFSGANLNSAMYDKGSINSQYYNNTCRMSGGGFGFLIQEDDATSQDPSGAIVRNNIFIKGPDPCIAVGVPGVTCIATMTNNCYQYSGGTVFNVTSPSTVAYSSLSAWQSATGKDASSIAATPTFTNGSTTLTLVTDYQPLVSSPVVNAGVAITGRTTDAIGSAIWETPDIGALEFTPHIFYISTAGSDANNGISISTPWRNLEKIASIGFIPGDIVYIRAGTYNSTAAASATACTLITGKNGNSGAHILISAYPADFPTGGRVTYNCTNVSHNDNAFGIQVTNCTYIDFVGINIKGPTQTAGVVNPAIGLTDGSVNASWWFTGGNHITATNCEASLTQTGFRNDQCNDATYTNCDAHDCDDPIDNHTTGPHNNSNGFGRFGVGLTTTNTVYNYCRAWNNANNGFDCSGTNGSITYNGSWAFHNGYYNNGTTLGGEGNGFQMGPGETTGLSRFVHNCLAAVNRRNGFDQNTGKFTAELFNNSALENGQNDFAFGDNQPIAHDFRNNVSYLNAIIDGSTADATNWSPNTNNTWNGAVTVTAADFNSLDETQLSNARLTDGGLPVITYGTLTASSDLVDAGTDVGLAFISTNPDMGAFESSFVGGGGGGITPAADTKLLRTGKLN